jgi:hypothetical protein
VGLLKIPEMMDFEQVGLFFNHFAHNIGCEPGQIP